MSEADLTKSSLVLSVKIVRLSFVTLSETQPAIPLQENPVPAPSFSQSQAPDSPKKYTTAPLWSNRDTTTRAERGGLLGVSGKVSLPGWRTGLSGDGGHPGRETLAAQAHRSERINRRDVTQGAQQRSRGTFQNAPER